MDCTNMKGKKRQLLEKWLKLQKLIIPSVGKDTVKTELICDQLKCKSKAKAEQMKSLSLVLFLSM